MSWLHDLSLMLFPKTCQVCGEALVDGEDVICVSCDLRMPRCNFHLHPDAELPMRFAASKIARVASMFPYIRHNEFARLIQRSKYNNRPDINRHLGRKFALELLPSGFFNGIDLLVPVPMHFWKQARRGFNQAAEIARGVSGATGIPVADNLVATRSHSTQTRKSASGRMANASGLFKVVYSEELQGKHILLIDDVITTGSTILSCADTLRAAVPSIVISVLSLAATRSR